MHTSSRPAATPSPAYQYNPQSQTDADDALEKSRAATLRMARDANYKPVPLRWPYLTTLMALLLVAIGIIVCAHITMPDSDSTAHVSSLMVRRAGADADADAAAERCQGARRDGLLERGQSGEVVVVTSSVPYYTVTPTSVVTLVSTATSTQVVTLPGTPASLLPFTTTMRLNGSTVTETYTSTAALQSYPISASTTAAVFVYPTTVVSVSTGHPYISYGKITITITEADGGTADTQSGSAQANSASPTAPTVVAFTTTATTVITSVTHGPTATKVTTPEPQTVVSVVAGGERTSTEHILGGYDLETAVSTVGGTTTTVDLSEVKVVSGSSGAAGSTVVVPLPTNSHEDGRLTIVAVGGSVVTHVQTRTRTPQASLVVYTTTPRTTTVVSTRRPTTITTTSSDATIVSTAVSTMSVFSAQPPAGASSNSSADGGRGRVTVTVLDLRPGYYFVSTFLPTMVAVLLSLPLRVIDANAKMYQPLRALARPGGARGSESFTLEFSGWAGGIRTSVSAAWHQAEFVPLITTLLVLLSSLLAPLATEALGLKLHGSCSLANESGCAGALGVSVAPAFALIGVLGLMIVLLVVLLALLGWRRRWKTGVRAGPWNLAGLASLTACPDLVEGTLDDRGSRRQQRSRATASEKSLKRALADRRFAFGVYEAELGRHAYGIVPVPVDAAPAPDSRSLTSDTDTDTDRSSFLRGNNDNDNDNDNDDDDDNDNDGAASLTQQPFLTLTVAYRAAFIVVLAALLAVDLAYHITAAGGGRSGSNPATNRFGFFVATNSFGVGFAMAAVGVAVSFGWTALLATVATIAPFQAMATQARPQPAERSVLLPSRPTNEFSSLWTAMQLLGLSVVRGDRHSPSRFARVLPVLPRIRRASDAPPAQHALFLALVAIMTLLSEFLPVLLANVPYRATQTRAASVACARVVAAVLVLMLLTLVASFVAVRWPALPADPRTLAGSMYYTVDSHTLPAAIRELEERSGRSLSLMTTAEKSRRVRELGRRYYYGDVVGQSGRRRFAVDAEAVLLDPVLEAACKRRGRRDVTSMPTVYENEAY